MGKTHPDDLNGLLFDLLGPVQTGSSVALPRPEENLELFLHAWLEIGRHASSSVSFNAVECT